MHIGKCFTLEKWFEDVLKRCQNCIWFCSFSAEDRAPWRLCSGGAARQHKPARELCNNMIRSLSCAQSKFIQVMWWAIFINAIHNIHIGKPENCFFRVWNFGFETHNFSWVWTQVSKLQSLRFSSAQQLLTGKDRPTFGWGTKVCVQSHLVVFCIVTTLIEKMWPTSYT